MPKHSPDIVIPGLTIKKNTKTPAYKQLYEGLRILIIDGKLRPKQRLPSSRILAEDFGVSRNVVMLAYDHYIGLHCL